jgi:hypothetical protein
MSYSCACPLGWGTYLVSISMWFETRNSDINDYCFFIKLAFWQSKLTTPTLKRTNLRGYNLPLSR